VLIHRPFPRSRKLFLAQTKICLTIPLPPQAKMTSTPKRQKNREGSYTPTASDEIDGAAPLKRKGGGGNYAVDDDTLQAARSNKYLAHMLPDGYAPQMGIAKGPLRDFRQRQTNAKQAQKAEDGPENPFTLRPLSKTYFDILKKRRELPVHSQRYPLPTPTPTPSTIPLLRIRC
jgi:hypothetical protein